MGEPVFFGTFTSATAMTRESETRSSVGRKREMHECVRIKYIGLEKLC